MAWTFTDDLDAYRVAVGELLSSQPVRHTVLLTVLRTLSNVGPDAFGAEPPLLGWWLRDGAVRAAALQTPPYPMLVTELPGQSGAQLAATLAARRPVLPGVNGAEPDVSVFASAWSQATGRNSHVRQRQRLYQLADLTAPDPSPDGAARIATSADAALVTSWLAEFAAETGQVDVASRGMIDERLSSRQLMMWDVAGKPASMAGITAVISGVARVGPVYTPPGLRGRGYGGGATTAISRLALERGAQFVVLFTDLANPTSNELYQRLGYRPVEDRVVVHFTA